MDRLAKGGPHAQAAAKAMIVAVPATRLIRRSTRRPARIAAMGAADQADQAGKAIAASPETRQPEWM